MEPASYLLKLFTRKRSHGLRAHTPLRDRTENQAGGSLIVRSLSDNDVVILTHNKVETNQPSSHFFYSSFKGLQPFGRVPGFLDALLSKIHQANVGRHSFPPA